MILTLYSQYKFRLLGVTILTYIIRDSDTCLLLNVFLDNEANLTGPWIAPTNNHPDSG